LKKSLFVKLSVDFQKEKGLSGNHISLLFSYPRLHPGNHSREWWANYLLLRVIVGRPSRTTQKQAYRTRETESDHEGWSGSFAQVAIVSPSGERKLSFLRVFRGQSKRRSFLVGEDKKQFGQGKGQGISPIVKSPLRESRELARF
jgi:hypothetical protein